MTLGKNLPRVPVHDIAIQQRDNELVIGTHGRSIYITKLDAVQKAYDAIYNKQAGMQQNKAVLENMKNKETETVEPGDGKQPKEVEEK